jgi:DNA processing protein
MNSYAEEEKFWIWLASLGLGAKPFYQTLRLFGSAAAFFDAVKNDSDMLLNLPDETVRLARVACSEQRIAELLCELSSKDIFALTRLSADYPEPLATIPWPPPVLFVKGRIDSLHRAIGIVGTRRCTRRGYEHTRRIASKLDGMCVVSGLARGIDTAAHLGALDADIPTIAVLGCGVDVVYPPENEEIYHRIIQNGAVISELPIGATPYMGNFPVRNRIIAGLSRGLFVVESEMKGGTAITASLAVQYGKDIFAMPGPPYLNMSELPNSLISAGAVSVRDAADILAYYGEHKTAAKDQQAQPVLDFTQARIYELLHQQDLSAEGVAALSGLAPGEVNIALTMMELSGVIRRVQGGKYGV